MILDSRAKMILILYIATVVTLSLWLQLKGLP